MSSNREQNAVINIPLFSNTNQWWKHWVTSETFKKVFFYLCREKFNSCTSGRKCKKKSKVKVTLVQALRSCTGLTAHRGSRGIDSSTLSWPTALEGVEGSASRPGRALPPGKIRYPLYRRLGGPQGRKISPPPGFDSRTVQFVTSRYADYAKLWR